MPEETTSNNKDLIFIKIKQSTLGSYLVTQSNSQFLNTNSIMSSTIQISSNSDLKFQILNFHFRKVVSKIPNFFILIH